MSDIVSILWEPIAAANIHPSPDGIAKEDAPNTVPEVLREMKAATKRFYQQINPLLVSSGSGNIYVLTYPQAPEGYTKGIRYMFFSDKTNTGAATLNINGLGAKPILQRDGVALLSGQIVSCSATAVVFDGTAFRLENYVSNPKFSGTVSADAVEATTLTGSHVGNGSGLTNLNATQLTSGTVADGRLPATMTGKMFSSAITVNGPLTATTLVGNGASVTNVNAITLAGYTPATLPVSTAVQATINGLGNASTMNFFYGTAAPASNFGADGDVYFRYE